MTEKDIIKSPLNTKKLYEIINNFILQLNKIKDEFSPKIHKHFSKDIEGLHKVATSGDYNDLKNIPQKIKVPNDTKDLTNNAGFITLEDLPKYKGATSESSGKSGLTPQPKAGEQEKALFGDGTYKPVVQSINGIEPDKTGNMIIENFPVGFEYFTFNRNIREDSIPYLGKTYKRSDFPMLWQFIQEQGGYLISEKEWNSISQTNNGNVPFYSSGDDVNTFRVPCIKCWTKAAERIEMIGTFLEAGVPNIKGEVIVDATAANKVLGAFDTKNPASHIGPAGNGDGCTLAFDASRSNSIYGKAETVQPESIAGMYCVIARGKQANIYQTELNRLNEKVKMLENIVLQESK